MEKTRKVHVAKWYHMIFFPDWLRRLYQKPRKLLGELVKPGMTAADIGCGLGFFTVELARMVGEKGCTLAVDFQTRMLDGTKRKAASAGVLDRVRLVQCSQNDLKLSEPVDFVLTMWVTHEVPDRDRFFRQIHDILKPDGRYLLVEPTFHVKKQSFRTICEDAERAGLAKISEPRVGLSRAALFVLSN